MQRKFVGKIFKTGGSQAVRLPKECQLPGDEVTVYRQDQCLILEPVNVRGWSREFLQMIVTPIADDALLERDQPPPQVRDGEL